MDTVQQLPPFSPGYWWTLGLEMEAGWTSFPVAIEFLGDHFWLRPGTDSALPDISIGAPDTNDGLEYYYRVRRFLSLLSWFDRRRINESVVVGSGGKVPMRVGNLQAANIKPQYATDFALRVELLPSVSDDDAWLGLALYREALGLNSIAYKVLGFLKIINIRYKTGPDQIAYMNGMLPFIADHFALERLSQLKTQVPDVGAYLYESCRCAVAHANTQPLVNPDSGLDGARLNADVNLIRAVAEHCIEFELGVKSHSSVYREHAYHLDGFKVVLTDAVFGALSAGISIPITAINIPNIDMRVRRAPQLAALAGMRVHCQEIDQGRISLLLTSANPPDAIEVKIALDLTKNELLFEPVTDMRYAEPKSASVAAAVIDFMEIQKQLLGNGIVEFYIAGSADRLGRLDPYLPHNISSQQGVKNMNAIIDDLRLRFGL